MKYYLFVLMCGVALTFSPVFSNSAAALSCLPIEEYFKTIVNNEDTVIFTGTTVTQTKAPVYTSEVLTIKEVHQGFVESSVIVYHQLDETWGYLCNNGPKNIGGTGLYIATRDHIGTYHVTQRLAVTDELATILIEDLEKAEVRGEFYPYTPEDRRNQILNTFTELMAQMSLLIEEYRYWSTQ